MISVIQAAARLGVSRRLVRRWIEDGRLRAERVGTVWVIREADADAMRGRNTKRGPQK